VVLVVELAETLVQGHQALLVKVMQVVTHQAHPLPAVAVAVLAKMVIQTALVLEVTVFSPL
jgi:hypothetical protein